MQSGRKAAGLFVYSADSQDGALIGEVMWITKVVWVNTDRDLILTLHGITPY